MNALSKLIATIAALISALAIAWIVPKKVSDQRSSALF
jgi:hypothetical protein